MVVTNNSLQLQSKPCTKLFLFLELFISKLYFLPVDRPLFENPLLLNFKFIHALSQLFSCSFSPFQEIFLLTLELLPLQCFIIDLPSHFFSHSFYLLQHFSHIRFKVCLLT